MAAACYSLVLVTVTFYHPGLSQDMAPARLSISPSRGQHFREKQMSLHCEVKEGNSTGWTLKHLKGSGVQSGCLPAGGNMSKESTGLCEISHLHSRNSGVYWCESAGGDKRSNDINVTVVDGSVIIQSPTGPVAKGDSLTLRCLYLWSQPNTTAFYKNGVEILSHNSTEVTLHNVTGADGGFYKCGDPDGDERSPESWVAVRGHFALLPTSPTGLLSTMYTSTEGAIKPQMTSPTELSPSNSPTKGSRLYVVVLCCILGVLPITLVLGLLACRYRSRMRCYYDSCCPVRGSRNEWPKEGAPQTKPDVTEIQWDMAWMEMETETTLLGRKQETGH
ncbi:uncharacterized protein LOC118770860 [Megalops cyprinoides]|uniref:uncharacterized protein LOC118770860 n=1 Tax=Megalops cyprinoides TaxID=118141 RepID=UPI0018646372|nr:uncharacterized protein LOC118770860 [Megalops cyprinoides]